MLTQVMISTIVPLHCYYTLLGIKMSLSQFKVAQAHQLMIYVPTLQDDVKAVKQALEAVKGVFGVTSDRPNKLVTLKFSTQPDLAEFKQTLISALERKGFHANEFREMPALVFQTTSSSRADSYDIKSSSTKKKNK